MKIGLIDADLLDNGTRHPNLALMKISGYYKSNGNEVTLIEDIANLLETEYDHLYCSKVFSFTKVREDILTWGNISIGGTGFFEDGGEDLPYEIEHHFPDYHLYDDYINHQIVNTDPEKKRGKGTLTYYKDYLNYSIGFLSRGCVRKCSFCINKKYDHAFRHSYINEWLDPSRPYIYLWDDNIFAFSEWREVFDELATTGKQFQFRQGLDIRFLNEEKAEVLSKAKYHSDIIFAFDHIEEAEIIRTKLALWRKYCEQPTKLYVLCGYDSLDIQDVINTLERIRILFEYGCIPYIMRYQDYKKSKYKGLYIQLARWCNQPQFLKTLSFKEYCERNQFYHKDKNTYCAAMRVYTDFSQKYPEIADKYFNMHFKEQPYVRELLKKREERRLKSVAESLKK